MTERSPLPVASARLAQTDIDGRKPTLVFLHGLGGTRGYWSAASVPLVGLGYRAVLIDLLGFGDSPKPWFIYTIERHVAALHSSLQALGDIVIVGHSMGAALAVHYAARHPTQVSGLCLLSVPHYGSLENAARWFSRSPGGWVYTNLGATALACVLTRRLAGRLLPMLLPDLPTMVARDLVKHHMLSSTSSLWKVLYRHDLEQAASALPSDLAALLIHGDRDTSAPIESARALASGRARWKFHSLDGVDHHPWLREPQQCMNLIVAWVDQLIMDATPVHRTSPACVGVQE